MTVLTEGQHTGEFLVSEANGTLSREVGVLLSGQDVKDGRVLKDNGTGKLVEATGSFDTEGVSDEDIVGIAYGDAKADGADAPVVYVARLAEVKAANVVLHEVATADPDFDESNAAVEAALLQRHIRLR
jgi:hypothetical protein